ncbi:nuclear transcription factor Y subunit beta isoform X1 [Rhinolophus sinicus]|uniref:nuclear transcription factor Y subunit beta isoform X1 n=1 Tax=Rhinolophus sinicus TaxID=89399 RepID=UPI003D7B9A05
MSVSCRRRPRRQRRGGRGHSPPSRPPSRPGRGRGRFGACEAAPAAGPAGKRARGRGAALCARGRGAAGRWPGRLPLVAAELRAGGREWGAGAPSGPPLGGARTSSILHGGLPGGGGGRSFNPRPRPRSFGLAAERGSLGSAPLPPAGAWRGRAALSVPATLAPPGGRAVGVGRGPGAWARRVGGMRARGVRRAQAGLTDRRGSGAGASSRTFVGRKRGPWQEGVDLVSPQSGLHVKNATIWRLAVPGLAPKVEIGQQLDTILDGCS